MFSLKLFKSIIVIPRHTNRQSPHVLSAVNLIGLIVIPEYNFIDSLLQNCNVVSALVLTNSIYNIQIQLPNFC